MAFNRKLDKQRAIKKLKQRQLIQSKNGDNAKASGTKARLDRMIKLHG